MNFVSCGTTIHYMKTKRSPKPLSVVVPLRLPQPLYELIRKRAASEEASIQYVVRRVLSLALDPKRVTT